MAIALLYGPMHTVVSFAATVIKYCVLLRREDTFKNNSLVSTTYGDPVGGVTLTK